MSSVNPLKSLSGIWNGVGEDVAPGPDMENVVSPYTEVMTIEDAGVVDNHSQLLNCLRYSTRVFRVSNQNMFHEETGYFLWDESAGKLMRTFVIPRGVAVHAEGKINQTDEYCLKAEPESGIGMSLFLKDNFYLCGFEVSYTFTNQNMWSYWQKSTLKIQGQEELFTHTDRATMSRSE